MTKSNTPSENPRLLLEYVLNLIARDIHQIYDLSKKGKLEHETSADLVRYSGALLNIVKDLDSQSEEFKKSLGKLSTEDLMKKAESALTELKKDFIPNG